ncbi:MAG: hypothetical protein U9R79_14380 [Armatimonadota bacterium]|nr:hypothetical protein [Armatimonadota bacterium]
MNRTVTAVVVVALLVGVALVNQLGSTSGPEPPDKAPEPQATEAAGEQLEPEDVPLWIDEPIGPEDAPVQVEWFFEADNECQTPWEQNFREMATSYAPNVRLVFRPWHLESTAERAEQIGDFGCTMGVAVNGKVEWHLADRGKVNFTAPPDLEEWTWEDLARVIELELERAGAEYEGAGGDEAWMQETLQSFEEDTATQESSTDEGDDSEP